MVGNDLERSPKVRKVPKMSGCVRTLFYAYNYGQNRTYTDRNVLLLERDPFRGEAEFGCHSRRT